MIDNALDTAMARDIWETKYRLHVDGVPQERHIQESWRRVASSMASGENDPALWAERFYRILEGFNFLPGGRILAGAGSGQRVTLLNCFVMGIIEDDMESIFDRLKEGALTMQAGGGTGFDFSTLRPRDSIARASGRIASGPVSFMRIWDAMCDTIMSTGARRGAMISSLRCDHPDIEEFIDAKRNPGELQHFNLSVQVTDAFMQAVEQDDSWPLIFPADGLGPTVTDAEVLMRRWSGRDGEVACRVLKRIPARLLWERIMRSAYDTAEPGVLFIDRINALNNLDYREQITTTNPCGEIPLPPYGACDLGSINLTRFVLEPFTSRARMDMAAIQETVEVATRLLDNAIDRSYFPLEIQAAQARGSRRIGLGITGLADTLIMLGLHYAQPAAREMAAGIMQAVCHSAYLASIQLAKEKGCFPFFDREKYMRGAFVRLLPQRIRQEIGEHGIRNSHLTAIAPAGSISLLAGNVSSGIEPVFDFRYRRRMLNREGNYETFEVEDYAFRQWQQKGAGELPACFVDACSLSPQAHLAMQAALQPFVDNAISKTINIPEDYAFDAFCSLYESAYHQGVKGCTAFRPTKLREGILLSGEMAAHCCSIKPEEN